MIESAQWADSMKNPSHLQTRIVVLLCMYVKLSPPPKKKRFARVTAPVLTTYRGINPSALISRPGQSRGLLYNTDVAGYLSK